MADVDVICAAGNVLEEKCLALTSFVEVCDQLDEYSRHRWLFVVGGLAHALNEAVQAYLVAVNQHALPHLRDLAALTKPSGGMGAVAPMATKVPASELITSRK
ncbi:hypothetical protein [Hydrogenophaga sp. NFH-34]|uniref:hypothetical protein n=1 Tax=Hydrogenophaga sp. NFH-34 TaxID=2744446 RepID=UPI001F2F6713|nr:hypothetical protein [Hydrogenophaga sp. NFH-34]